MAQFNMLAKMLEQELTGSKQTTRQECRILTPGKVKTTDIAECFKCGCRFEYPLKIQNSTTLPLPYTPGVRFMPPPSEMAEHFHCLYVECPQDGCDELVVTEWLEGPKRGRVNFSPFNSEKNTLQ